MKKTFTRVIMALGILCSGAVVTSCDEDTITQIINIIGNLINTGQTYTYTGTATSQSLTGSADNKEWVYINATKSNPEGIYEFQNMEVSLNSSKTGTGTLTIPAYQEGNVTTSLITISGLSMAVSSDQSNTKLSIGEESRIEGSLTYNGKNYTAANLSIAEAQSTNGDQKIEGTATSAALQLEMTIYFQGEEDGDDYSKAINFTYVGKAETAQ